MQRLADKTIAALSHRSGMAETAIETGPTWVGIDLELIEAHPDEFVREWVADDRREGLRLDVRRADVILGVAEKSAHWARSAVHWDTEGLEHRGSTEMARLQALRNRKGTISVSACVESRRRLVLSPRRAPRPPAVCEAGSRSHQRCGRSPQGVRAANACRPSTFARGQCVRRD